MGPGEKLDAPRGSVSQYQPVRLVSWLDFYYLCSKGYKQGKEACDARMIPKQELEEMVIDQLRAKVLTDENLEKLVRLVNEELYTASHGLQDRLDAIDADCGT